MLLRGTKAKRLLKHLHLHLCKYLKKAVMKNRLRGISRNDKYTRQFGNQRATTVSGKGETIGNQ
ncbi:hypothetical protein Tco_1488431, partial [Tanacetum coccineum]